MEAWQGVNDGAQTLVTLWRSRTFANLPPIAYYLVVCIQFLSITGSLLVSQVFQLGTTGISAMIDSVLNKFSVSEGCLLKGVSFRK